MKGSSYCLEDILLTWFSCWRDSISIELSLGLWTNLVRSLGDHDIFQGKWRLTDYFLLIGCPYAKDPNSGRAGTGGPDPNTSFQGCDGNIYKRNCGGSIPDEIGKEHQRITNAPGTLSMANTGRPESGGSQFFINVNHNSFLDWFDNSSPSEHPVFGKVRKQ